MADSRGQGGLAGVCHLLPSQRDLAPLGGASEGPQTAGLVVWPSGGAVGLGSVVARAVGAAKARTAEGCPAVVGGASGRGLVEPRGCTAVGRQVLPWGPLGGLFLPAALCSFSEPVGPLGPYTLPAYSRKTGPRGALQERPAATCLYGNWSGCPGVSVTT